MRVGLLAGLVLAAAGCRSAPAPVTLQASPAEMSSLAGEWTGDYTGDDSHRSGSIVFTIRPGAADSAVGDVVMVTSAGMPVTAAHERDAHLDHAPSMNVLAISFVRVSTGAVSGALEPFVSPDCSCTVRTTFAGTVAGDTISGTFVTVGDGIQQRGRWQVSRR